MRLEEVSVGDYILFSASSNNWVSFVTEKKGGKIYLIDYYCSNPSEFEFDGKDPFPYTSDDYEQWILLKVYDDFPKEFLI